MEPRFVFTEAAESQFLGILDDLSEESESAAVRVRMAVFDALGRLVGMPEMGHTREDLTSRPVKFWPVFSYLIVYDPQATPLTVLAVLHGARDVETLLRSS